MPELSKNFKTAAKGLAIMAVSLIAAAFWLGEKMDLKRNRRVLSTHTVKIPQSINWIPARLASQEAIKAGKPIFCVFTAEQNQACRDLETNVLSDRMFSDYVNANFVPVLIVYLESLPETAQEKVVSRTYGINSFPTLLITDPKGNKIAEKKTAFSKENSIKFLSEKLKLPAKMPARAEAASKKGRTPKKSKKN